MLWKIFDWRSGREDIQVSIGGIIQTSFMFLESNLAALL